MTAIDFQQEFVWVHVHSPTVNDHCEDGKYTTYQVEVKTNSLSFTKKHSLVQRTYSEFLWLRKVLRKTAGRSPPSLPLERLFGRFEMKYLNQNQTILTNFIQEVVKNTFFVSSAALHLFLQTDLSMDEMTNLIRELNKRRASMNALVRAKSLILSHNSTNVSLLEHEVLSGSSDQESVNSVSSSTHDEHSASESLSERSGCRSSSEEEDPWELFNNVDLLMKNENFEENLQNQPENNYEIDSDYPKWLIAESPRKRSAATESRNSQRGLSKSYTEVSWSLSSPKHHTTLPKEHHPNSPKHGTLSTSPVHFSIGGKLIKNLESFSGFFAKEQSTSITPRSKVLQTSAKNLSCDQTTSQSLRKARSCNYLPASQQQVI